MIDLSHLSKWDSMHKCWLQTQHFFTFSPTVFMFYDEKVSPYVIFIAILQLTAQDHYKALYWAHSSLYTPMTLIHLRTTLLKSQMIQHWILLPTE